MKGVSDGQLFDVKSDMALDLKSRSKVHCGLILLLREEGGTFVCRYRGRCEAVVRAQLWLQ